MQGDLGFLLTFGLKGTGNWNRIEIPSGTVGAWKIKTTEYNQPTYYTFDFAINPETPSGSVFMSVSECPGDFTSPQVMSQTMGYDADNTGNTVGDQKFRNCFRLVQQMVVVSMRVLVEIRDLFAHYNQIKLTT